MVDCTSLATQPGAGTWSPGGTLGPGDVQPVPHAGAVGHGAWSWNPELVKLCGCLEEAGAPGPSALHCRQPGMAGCPARRRTGYMAVVHRHGDVVDAEGCVTGPAAAGDDGYPAQTWTAGAWPRHRGSAHRARRPQSCLVAACGRVAPRGRAASLTARLSHVRMRQIGHPGTVGQVHW